ncbi:MAG: tRNA lysidine(34) synthetase TilS [Planctomycetia bacterium]|nr:tRNA lysidine(34) synthetase TilS [Planctomycetia bacterium]
MIYPLEKRVEQSWSPAKWKDHRICIAVSGGADSVSLFCSMVRIARKHDLLSHLFAGHINHGARGKESDEDALFVQDLTRRYDVPCFTLRLDSEELARKGAELGSWENAARILRYQYLQKCAEEQGARYLLTAHTADDQLETILHRLFRGTGMEGLRAIPRIRPLNDAIVLVRPLLDLNRSDITDYLRSLDQPFRTDSSNSVPLYTRNQIRLELIPVLERIFPNRWKKSLLRLSRLSEQIGEILSDKLQDLKENAVHGDLPRSCRVIVSRLDQEPEYIINEFFRSLWKEKNWPLGQMGQKQWNRLSEMIRSQEECRMEFPDGIVARRIDGVIELRDSTDMK